MNFFTILFAIIAFTHFEIILGLGVIIIPIWFAIWLISKIITFGIYLNKTLTINDFKNVYTVSIDGLKDLWYSNIK